MSDDADKKAAELLPCRLVTRQCNGAFEELCTCCYYRPAVAAALRERDEALNNLRAIHRESAERFITDREQLQAEIERIKSLAAQELEEEGQIQGKLRAEIATFKAELAKARKQLWQAQVTIKRLER